MYQHDPRHIDVLVKDLGLENGNSVQTPATPACDRRGKARATGAKFSTISTDHRLPDVCSSVKIEQT